MRRKLHVRRGDTVEVVAGNAKGQRGRVLRSIPEKGRVVVEGVNMVWKHMRRSREHPRGGRIQIEAPMHASNVMLLCPSRDCPGHDKPVRAKQVVREDGTKVRACVKCGTEIPKAE
ncbi:MAG: 50S ribosomal protein L24 [Candidatus Brocadiae bacterium]|nr:50S ribosomal protein L24 [Candidatus Brocadiia bacterium]